MTDRNTGGAAFPHNHFGEDHTGMTLRDWFAGQTLPTAMMMADAIQTVNGTREKTSGMVARIAYSIADAMLEERNK